MSKRPKTIIRTIISFVVCVLLGTALLTSPGAWAQIGSARDHTVQNQNQFQNSEAGTTNEDAAGVQNETPYFGSGDSSLREDPSTTAIPDKDDHSEADPSGLSDPSAFGAKPGYGSVFQATISIGDNQVPCRYWVNNQEGTSVAIGTRTVTSSGKFTYYEAAVTDKDIPSPGPLVIPKTVTYKDKTGASYTYKVTAVGDCAFAGCKKITTTGLAGNTSITSLNFCAYESCTGVTSTGLEKNSSVTTLGIAVFQNCSNEKFKTTGLAGNTTITSIAGSMFQFCHHLESTGLDENTTVGEIGSAAFGEDEALKFTGLEKNSKVILIRGGAFKDCTALTSTGLEYENSKVTILQDNVFYGCTGLLSTGLDKNKSIINMGILNNELGVFQNCTSLVSTGLELNKTIMTIGMNAFKGCTSLGTKDTDTANAGDLALNGRMGVLSVGKDAFMGTKYERVYLGSYLRNPRFSVGALDTQPGKKIPALYVPDTWHVNSYTFGDDTNRSTYSTKDKSLVIMAKPLSDMKAKRTAHTSDQAQITFTAGSPFWAKLSDGEGHELGSYELSGTQTSPWTISLEPGTGLSPKATTLTAQISSSKDGPVFTDEGSVFVYPANKAPRVYNHLTQSFSCGLDPLRFTIVFDGNGGGGTMANQDVDYDPDKPLNGLDFTLKHMSFKHWSTSKDDTGSDRIIRKDKDCLGDLIGREGDTTTLYAQWQIGLEVISSQESGEPLKGISYALSATSDEKTLVGGLSTDPEGLHPIIIDPQVSAGQHWPLISDAEGKVSMYWLTKGTYYLFNTAVVAGYEAASSPMQVVVGDKNNAAWVKVGEGEVKNFQGNTAQMSLSFSPAKPLPSTGNLPAAFVQAIGILSIIAVVIVALRRLRRKRHMNG